jgi:hypothetical protein
MLRYREAIKIVCGCDRARKVLTDFRLALLLFAQSPEHAVRQHQSLDVRLMRDLSDYPCGVHRQMFAVKHRRGRIPHHVVRL